MSKSASLATATDSSLRIRRVGVFLGAEITGIDLTRPLDAVTVEALKQAHAQYDGIVLPNQ